MKALYSIRPDELSTVWTSSKGSRSIHMISKPVPLAMAVPHSSGVTVPEPEGSKALNSANNSFRFRKMRALILVLFWDSRLSEVSDTL